jgi:steroid delta-isomerase-like uncharacterized protein
MEAATQFGAGAERVESIEWLRDWVERYTATWNSHDPAEVAAFMAEDVVFEDPALPAPARGRDEVAAFAVATFTAFPDWQVSVTGTPAISDDGLVAYVPWRMTGTNTGPIDPPGFAPTGRSYAIEAVTRVSFRAGLVWRDRDIYDGTDVSRQLGLMPSAGSRGERMLVRMQRLRARFSR